MPRFVSPRFLSPRTIPPFGLPTNGFINREGRRLVRLPRTGKIFNRQGGRTGRNSLRELFGREDEKAFTLPRFVSPRTIPPFGLPANGFINREGRRLARLPRTGKMFNRKDGRTGRNSLRELFGREDGKAF